MTSRSQGLPAWLFQRLSSVYLAVFLLYVMGHFLLDPPRSQPDWQQWMTRPAMAIATAIFFGALLVHAWVGMRDVIIDYVKVFAVRFVLLSLLGLVLIGLGLWAARILLMGTA